MGGGGGRTFFSSKPINGKNMLPIVNPVFSMNYFGQNFHSYHWLLFLEIFDGIKEKALKHQTIQKNFIN